MVVIHKKKVLSAEEKQAQKLKEQEQSLGIQDEYQLKGFELVSWVQDHKNIVIAAIVVIFLGGLALSGYTYYKQRSAEAATTAYLDALRPLEEGEEEAENKEKWQEAQKQLIALSKAHPNVGPALLADIYAGHIALENKESAQAVELYTKALKGMDAKNELYPLVLIGLGYALESNGQHKEAIKAFMDVIELKGTIAKDLALFEAGRISNEIKEGDKAKGFIARLLEEYPASIFERQARALQESF